MELILRFSVIAIGKIVIIAVENVSTILAIEKEIEKGIGTVIVMEIVCVIGIVSEGEG